MKKILVGLVLVVVSLNVFSQLSGDGSWGNPYKGTLTANVVWSSDVYIGGDVLTSVYSITVNAGVKVIFLTDSADLKIRGAGSLIADGTSGSTILFTADDDNDGIYGETGPPLERWGHISFEASTGSSVIDFCIIEFGSKTTGTGVDTYGGGIHANTGNLTISNSIIRKNSAIYGGGIFVNKNRSTPITNCIISNNSASYAGGGLYFWDGSSSAITNCIISNNQVTASYKAYLTGGGLASITGTSIKVVNCTFVNNSSNATDGQGICFYGSSSNAAVVNSVFWGSGNQYYPTSPGSTITQYCAVQGASYTTCLNLSSGNTDPAGPNFNNPAGSDWSIKVISPCRDAGTTPSPTVPNDYVGNTRVRNYDIGAYEVQYNYWLTSAGSSDWNTGGNWNGGLPTSSQNIVILSGASNYPTGSSSLDYTIGAGYGLVLEPGAKATFNTLTKTGDLKLMSNSSATSSLITNNSVNAIIELYLTGGGGTNYKWHYISSPVSSLPVNTFVLTSTMDFAQFFEARPVTAPQQGWVAYDGWYYSGGYFLTGSPYVISGTNMNVGQGYNYYYPTDYKFSFSGSTNISTVSPAITFGGNASLHGFNLLGNPFPSGLNWTTIINDAGFPTSTSKGLYYTRNNSQCSFIAGVGYPDATVTGVIPPMQGFFIHTTNTSATLPLLSSARVHNIPARYKGGEEIIPLVRLQLDNDTLMDNTVVRFDTKASASYDNDFDAVRMFLSESVQYIYSTDGATKYAINGQPFSETEVLIPISVNVITSGNHTITASQLQGLDDYDVKLKDNVTGFIADLKTNPVITFSSEIGAFADRFVLQISNITTGETPVEYLNNDNFNIYQASSFINILTVSDSWDGKTGSMKIYNLTGQMIGSDNGVEFNKNSLIQIPEPSVKGLYFVELKSGMQRYVGKVIVK